MFNFNYNFNSR